jgi:hypothetical protein
VRVVEHVSKEGTVGFGVAAVDDDVATIDHAGSVLVGRRGPAGAAAISGGVPVRIPKRDSDLSAGIAGPPRARFAWEAAVFMTSSHRLTMGGLPSC